MALASGSFVRTILAQVRATRPTLMITPPCIGETSWDERVRRLSERFEPLCRELCVPFLPIFPRLEGVDVWRREGRSEETAYAPTEAAIR